jgi:Tfp pilus assembly protein PilN
MTLTEALARDPPGARRFRLLAPLLVLLCLALLAMAPGLLIHWSVDEQEPAAQSIDQFVTYEGR